MNTKLLFLSLLFVTGFSATSVAQMTVAPVKSKQTTEQKESTESLSLKPVDGTPAKFTTKEEMESALPQKIANIKEMINSGKYEGQRLQYLREELWRFENAVVAPK